MKYISLIIVFNLFIGFADAQKPGARLLALGLKGKVKQVTAYIYQDVEDFDRLGIPKKNTVDFDEKGNQLDDIDYPKTGQIKKTLFNYTKGRIIQSQYNNGKLNPSFIQVYDDKGYEIECDMNSAEDTSKKIPKSEYKVIVKYDNSGNKVQEDTYLDGNKLTDKSIFIYNDKNQIVEEDRSVYFSTGIKKEKSINIYDSTGYKIKSETYDSLGSLIDEYTVSYSDFDLHGNWRSKTFIMKMHNQTHGDSLSKDITKREIVYFK